ncbi:hypothetical protein K1Y78_61050, partial [Streptomyces sp. tea 10]|nr:hypothetical protein [Streptomyces sp. tea 10]
QHARARARHGVPSLTPEVAPQRIRETLTHPDTDLTSDGTTLTARLGSDLTFRRRGAALLRRARAATS